MATATERTSSARPRGARSAPRWRKGPATVPALAAACELPPREVLWHIAAMRKYGELAEDAQDGDYFTYRLVSEEG